MTLSTSYALAAQGYAVHRSPFTAAATFRLALLTLVGAASSCVATVQERPIRGVAVAPPLPLTEARPAPPAPGMVWAAGYWHWAEVHYVWVPGHWESPSFDVAAAPSAARATP